jgi:hypothetical protein
MKTLCGNATEMTTCGNTPRGELPCHRKCRAIDSISEFQVDVVSGVGFAVEIAKGADREFRLLDEGRRPAFRGRNPQGDIVSCPAREGVVRVVDMDDAAADIETLGNLKVLSNCGTQASVRL